MLSQATQQLIQKYQLWFQSIQAKDNDILTIHVDEIASKVAAFYEKIKGVVDWKEEHLLRKRAIERSLKRRIIFKHEKKEKIAESLIYELIMGGHFPNNSIPESKIENVQNILNKYFFILENAPQKELEQKTSLQNWLLDIASYEIEKTLSPYLKEEALVEYMNNLMNERIKISQGPIAINRITEQEKNTQIYIAVQRALFKFDESTITYYLLSAQYPEWHNLSPISCSIYPEYALKSELELEKQEQTTVKKLLKITENIYILQNNIKKQLNHPLSEKFFKICERYNTPYLILGDIIKKDPNKAEKNLENRENLENLIKTAYKQRLLKLKKRLRRAAFYSTISIFITKIAISLAIEIPIEKFIIDEFNFFTLGINILFPPFLMFLLVISIKPPKKENLERIIMEVSKICYQKDKKDIYELRMPKKKGKTIQTIILIIYGLAFIVSLGIIINILQRLNFGILSMAIFIFFVSMISFFGVKIRERSKELVVEERKEKFLSSVFDLFTLPVLRMGKFFSNKWGKLNIALIISALIDMPFLTFVEFLEQWRYFLKEKKEEIH